MAVALAVDWYRLCEGLVDTPASGRGEQLAPPSSLSVTNPDTVVGGWDGLLTINRPHQQPSIHSLIYRCRQTDRHMDPADLHVASKKEDAWGSRDLPAIHGYSVV